MTWLEGFAVLLKEREERVGIKEREGNKIRHAESQEEAIIFNVEPISCYTETHY